MCDASEQRAFFFFFFFSRDIHFYSCLLINTTCIFCLLHMKCIRRSTWDICFSLGEIAPSRPRPGHLPLVLIFDSGLAPLSFDHVHYPLGNRPSLTNLCIMQQQQAQPHIRGIWSMVQAAHITLTPKSMVERRSLLRLSPQRP
jgi:hypothetical protein